MTTSSPTRASVGLRSERGPVLLGVMLSVGLVAIVGAGVAAIVMIGAIALLPRRVATVD